MKKLLFTFALLLMLFTANAQTCPDNNHPHAIDLELPSGTKWACCNIGSTKPDDCGGYYTWGECETKAYYSNKTNKYYQNGEMLNIGDDISGTKYDAAHTCWGDNWFLPTNKQVEELIKYTTHRTSSCNSIQGYEFIGKNGNSIFLPLCGVIGNNILQKYQSIGFYWTSQQHPEYKSSAYILGLEENDVSLSSNGRNWGHSIRPVWIQH